jgi:hypothetical protein
LGDSVEKTIQGGSAEPPFCYPAFQVSLSHCDDFVTTPAHGANEADVAIGKH